MLKVNINGTERVVEAAPDTPLLWVLRDHLDLTGTKFGCGTVINPDIVAAQMESGIVFGLTAALYGEITIKGGAVEQKNFPDYEMLRMADMPRIETHVVALAALPGGVGEPATPPVAPALANALFKLTGKPVRALPIRLT